MPKYITKQDMYSSVQLGASQVAAALHLSPWDDAFGLWQSKTGRVPKPEQTPAMKWGLDNEGRTIHHYLKANHIDPRSIKTQIAAEHRDFSWLRCVADVWNEPSGELVQVKSPSTPHLIREMKSSGVPLYYAVQCLDEMDIFEAESELFYAVDWTQDPPECAEKLITWDMPWDLTQTCRQFWEGTAIPMLVEFWQRIVDDTWPNGGYVQPDEQEWMRAISLRQTGLDNIAKGEKLKAIADSRLKQMLGSSQSASAGGYKASWVGYRPTWGVSIKVEGPQTLETVMKSLEGLRGVEGVREVEAKTQPERRVFFVKEISK